MSGYRLCNPSAWTPVSCICFCIRNQWGWHSSTGRWKILLLSTTPVYMDIQDAQANGFVATLKDNPEAKMGILHAAYGRSFCIWENPLNSRGCDERCRSACRPPGRYPVRTTSPVVIPLHDFSWTCHSKHYRPRGRLPPQESRWYNLLHLLILSSSLISFVPSNFRLPPTSWRDNCTESCR